jgi:hypothetical protein
MRRFEQGEEVEVSIESSSKGDESEDEANANIVVCTAEATGTETQRNSEAESDGEEAESEERDRREFYKNDSRGRELRAMLEVIATSPPSCTHPAFLHAFISADLCVCAAGCRLSASSSGRGSACDSTTTSRM